MAIERSFDANPEKPYLTALPRVSDEGFVFEWLSRLFDVAGLGSTIEALRYCREIGWITEGAEAGLCEYVHGLDEGGNDDGSSGMDEHVESLIYVTWLASMTDRSE